MTTSTDRIAVDVLWAEENAPFVHLQAEDSTFDVQEIGAAGCGAFVGVSWPEAAIVKNRTMRLSRSIDVSFPRDSHSFARLSNVHGRAASDFIGQQTSNWHGTLEGNLGGEAQNGLSLDV
jgi:hypothetical protein